MFKAVESPYLVPFNGKFNRKKTPVKPPQDAPKKKECKRLLKDLNARLAELQQMLYAQDQWSLLMVFQAMDAAGKDSTIRAILNGVNPAGCQVFSFKKPSEKELDHDFLWRTARSLPERGRIGIFNRSYYEEVLVVRVHPEFLKYQKLPEPIDPKTIWKERFTSIRDHEKHLVRNGMVVLKFWLNVSKEEQARRFISRIEESEKNWKFSTRDVEERQHWDSYMHAYEDLLNATSREWAPWYAIPADDKPFMRYCVADIAVRTLESLNLAYPQMDPLEKAKLGEMREQLEAEI